MNVDVGPFVILSVTTGSHAYGLAGPASDLDRRGVFVPPAAWHWSLTKPPEQVESIVDGVDAVDFEVEKFVRLALKGSPTVLEMLWSPLVTHTTLVGDELRRVRGAFLSRAVVDAYLGYAQSQAALVKRKAAGGARPYKPAMHLIRLLHAGLHVCRTGEVLVEVGEHAAELRAIRNGEVSAAEVEARAAALTGELQAARATCPLPPAPDVGRAAAFLLTARRHGLTVAWS